MLCVELDRRRAGGKVGLEHGLHRAGIHRHSNRSPRGLVTRRVEQVCIAVVLEQIRIGVIDTFTGMFES